MLHTARKWILGILVACYVASLFVYLGTGVFNAPDEHATSLFIEQIRQGELPRIHTGDQSAYLNALHPRSTTVVGEYIVPIGFLGLPVWYGLFAGILPDRIPSEILTPFLVILALQAWHGLMRKWFSSPQLAWISTVFLATLPAFWYYAARGLMPNVPFVCLLILALYIMEVRYWDWAPAWVYSAAAGALVGAAASFRLFELPQILFAVGVYFVYARKRILWKEVALFVIAFALTLMPIFAMQKMLYGSPLATGYTVDNALVYSLPSEDPVAKAASAVAQPVEPSEDRWLNILLPFGFHEYVIVNTVFENVFLLMPIFTVLAVLGFLLVARRKSWWPLTVCLIGLAVWLFAVYGSWRIADNPDIHAITLANSYSRYWLPVYLFAIPFAAIGFDELASRIAPKRKELAVMVGLVVWVVFGAYTVLRGPDGMLTTRARLQQFAQDRELLLEIIPQDATVITRYADKYLYPQREVVIGLTNSSTIYALPGLLERGAVYYFGITLPPQDLEFFQKEVLNRYPEKYKMLPVTTLRDQTLYQFVRSDGPLLTSGM